ncbi:MAG: hypothetical protein LIP23_00920 [Planctomycetes bacterium]|nr:hypothetical protein [Planctomycetota bacterium]
MANKSFMVVDGELRLKITPDSGWYCVEGLDIKGLVTQGRTIEEAIYMAHDAAKALAESRAIMAAQKAAKSKAQKTKIGANDNVKTTRKQRYSIKA